MTMDRWEYGDPLEVAARREARERRQQAACGACIHRREMDWKGQTWSFCEYKRRSFGTRCELYKTKDANE